MSNKAPLLFLLLTAVLALSGLGVFRLAGTDPKEAAPMPETTLLFAADLHYIAPSLTDHGAYFENMIENSDGKVMEYIEELTDAFLAEVIDRAPAALILPGDVSFNGARESHEALAAKLADVTAAGIPVLVLPGNHDLQNRDAARFRGDGFTRVDSVTAAEFAEIYAGCGYGGALSRDEASLSYVCELSPRLRILLLDVNMPESKNIAKPETLVWAEAQLRDAAQAGARVVAVSHQNLFRHNRIIYQNYVIENADAILALYEKYGVIANFSGHLHCQHIAADERGFADIATSSLAVSPNHYGVVVLTEDAGRYDAVSVDVSGWARKQGLDDANLLDFASYARDFFRRSGRDNAPSNYGPDLAGFIADVNEAYFAGRMDTIDLGDPRFDTLLESGGFMGQYLSSTRDDGPADMTHAVLY